MFLKYNETTEVVYVSLRQFQCKNNVIYHPIKNIFILDV